MPHTRIPNTSIASARREPPGGVPEAVHRLAASVLARGDTDEALTLHGIAAEAGHAGSQVEYARMLLHGVGVDPDPHRAVEWLLRAEALGNPVAGYYLALVALGSVVLPRDGRINERMLEAVRHDYPPALRAAAIHFGRRAEPQAQALCIHLLQRAAGCGDAVSAQLLAERMRRGEGCAAQPAAAEGWLHRQGAARLPGIDAGEPQRPVRGARPAPVDTLAFEEALTPARTHPLGRQPRVERIDGLLSADECRLLVATALPRLRPLPMVGTAPAPWSVDDGVAGGGNTGGEAVFDPAAEDFALRVLQLRMARSARVELARAEPLRVRRDLPGAPCRPHRDYLPTSALIRDRPLSGNRLRTLRVYLNAAGGGLAFPLAGLQVPAAAGRAVLFDNLDADGVPDPDSLHADTPGPGGERWTATLWLREQRYRDY